MPAEQTNYFNIGLTSAQIQKNLAKFGYNEIPTGKKFTAIKIFFSQFSSLLIIILIIAGSISILLEKTTDGLAIFGIVIINSIIGFIQEYKAENAVQALKKMVIPLARVLRNGQEKEIPIRELVPDDIVILSEGEKIPADIKILEAFSLKVDESMLTGESISINKYVGEGKNGKLYKGTIITTGRAKGYVISTGLNTEFGKIIELVLKEEKTRSPLAIQLDQLGKKIGIVILILIILLFILGTIRGISIIEMLMTSIALGICAIPEGMPIIVTLTLAIGVQIMARKRAIVRKMNAIETLGATTVICSDKTGTLTMNEMTIKKVNTNFKELEIPGSGYQFKEKIKLNSPEEKKLLEICENCNNSFVNKNILGDPTEIALKILTRKAEYTKLYKKLDENVFSSERKMMSSLHQVGNKQTTYAKGAFEEILKHCTYIFKNGKIQKISSADKKKYMQIAVKYSSQALRVLGLAYKEGKFEEENLIFVGLVGMMDPPRKSVPDSIKIAQTAGITIKIITGDNALTAKAVGKNIGLNVKNVITGDEIDKLNDRELLKIIYKTDIFARTKPEHKYRIVDLLQKNKEVVAVTGDGVNDAPALKHGDTGIAMGIKGTEATKEVADIVLKDDNFSTIIETIEEGRRIYHNILSFIKYMLSANYDSIMAVGVLTIMGYPLPLLPLQILWINIATDGLPALALGQSKAHSGIMSEKPHPKREQIFKKFFLFISVAAFIQTAVNIIIYFYGYSIDAASGTDIGNLSSPSHARTLVFTQIVLFELFLVFVCKEEKTITFKSFISNKSLIGAATLSFLLQLGMIYLPFMQTVFKTAPLNIQEWAIIILCASTALIVPKATEVVRQLKNFKL